MGMMSAPAKEKLALRIPEGDRDKFAVLLAMEPSSLDVLYDVLRGGCEVFRVRPEG
jgi:hypothetical protein